MAYTYIDPTRYDAESPITESLMTDIIENIESTAQGGAWSVLTGSGTYTVPASVTKLRLLMVSGGGGGGGAYQSSVVGSGGGGGGGQVEDHFLTVTPAAGLSYACGAGGTGGTGGVTPTSGGQGGSTTFDTLTTLGGHGGGQAGNSASIKGAGGNCGPVIVYSSPTSNAPTFFLGTGNGGGKYFGGHGGHGGMATTTIADSKATDGGATAPYAGAGGTASAVNAGGGGGPLALPMFVDAASAYLGAGGNGGVAGAGSNATLNGAGGGGGGNTGGGGGAGGNGTAGIIFYQIIG